MITAYRIFNTMYAAGWNDSEGAFEYGGRWNSPGARVLYTSSNLALAALEVLVHLDDEEIMADYSFATVRFPQDLVISVNKISMLPPDWRDYPASKSLREIGDQWVNSQASLVLRVPTAVVPQESNYVINLEHSSASRIEFGRIEPFVFDPRFVKGGSREK